MNIIGIGRAGCQIAKNFKIYKQYKVFCVDTENAGYPTFLPVKVQNSHEDYEKNYKTLNLSKCKGQTTVILSGGGKISGCALRLLEQLQKNTVDIIYIKPDETIMSEAVQTRDRITLGVLQEYARSNKINKIFIVSNKCVESITGGVSIKNYWDEVNNIISSTYHMINVFKNTEPLLTTSVASRPTVKIGTFGVVNFESESEKLFYDLKLPRVKNYFYGINDETLETDKEVLHKIRSFTESKKEERADVGFSIYPTDYDNSYVYSTHFATLVQEQDLEE